MEFCKGAIRLWKEHKSTFFYPRSDRALSSYKKSFRFSPAHLFAVFVSWKTVEFLFACKFSNFRSIFLFPEGKNFKVFTVRKFGQKTVVFIKYIIRFLPCASYRRLPSFIWRKTRKRWFPWILAQNKIICFSYRCGQYRDEELWKFGLFHSLIWEKNYLQQTKKNKYYKNQNAKNKTDYIWVVERKKTAGETRWLRGFTPKRKATKIFFHLCDRNQEYQSEWLIWAAKVREVWMKKPLCIAIQTENFKISGRRGFR